MAFNKDWITKKIDESAIAFADSFGNELNRDGFTTSQIRNYFGEVKRIQMKGLMTSESDFLLLKPKLAYAAKRANKRGAISFQKVMNEAHEAVACSTPEAEKRFKNFCDFLEAILAYHKAHGGN